MSKIEKINKELSYALQPITISDIGLSQTKKKKVVDGFSMWIRVLMQNWRQGTVGCKGRSDVNRTNKKPWKQKGTGRARAGSARSPLWRGGGVIFGPQPRVRTLSVSQKLKRVVLRNMIIDSISRDKMIVSDWEGITDKPSTALAAHFLKSIGLKDKSITLFLPWSDSVNRASFSNIATVRIVSIDAVNAYDMSNNSTFLILKKDLEQFKGMVSRWI